LQGFQHFLWNLEGFWEEIRSFMDEEEEVVDLGRLGYRVIEDY
jgi:hypothetical protein